jgi:hypothetical protein
MLAFLLYYYHQFIDDLLLLLLLCLILFSIYFILLSELSAWAPIFLYILSLLLSLVLSYHH